MYKVIRHFTDLQDSSYKYKEGDIYPRDGYTPSEKRIQELAGDSNKQGRPLIEAIPEAVPVEAEAPAEVAEPEEKPKKRTRKKSTDDE